MPRQFRFCIDIDNVIGQTDRVMRAAIAHFTNGRVNLEYNDIKAFDYFECRDVAGNGITKEEWKHVHDLFSTPRYLWQVEPQLGAVKALNELTKIGTVHLATSRLSSARRTTIEWLDTIGLGNLELHFLRHGEKHRSLGQFVAVVEDDYSQAKAFVLEGGTPTLLLRHPWNEKGAPIDGIAWANDWNDLTSQLFEMCRTTG